MLFSFGKICNLNVICKFADHEKSGGQRGWELFLTSG